MSSSGTFNEALDKDILISTTDWVEFPHCDAHDERTTRRAIQPLNRHLSKIDNSIIFHLCAFFYYFIMKTTHICAREFLLSASPHFFSPIFRL